MNQNVNYVLVGIVCFIVGAGLAYLIVGTDPSDTGADPIGECQNKLSGCREIRDRLQSEVNILERYWKGSARKMARDKCCDLISNSPYYTIDGSNVTCYDTHQEERKSVSC